MLRLYSPRAAERILRRYGETIDAVAARYALPGAVIRAILYQEITGIDLLDGVADALVQHNLRRGVRGPGRAQKSDSSTGYAQIYGFVAIHAINFAVERGLATYAALGLPGDRQPDPENMADLRFVWERLHREPAFNIECAALNLLSAAQEVTGRIDFPGYSPEELKRIFTRYNGTVPHVTPYGEAAYRHYLRYQDA